MQRELSIILENKPGALVRVVGLFHQRGYNIESLHVDPVTDLTRFSYIEERLDIEALKWFSSNPKTMFKFVITAKEDFDEIQDQLIKTSIIDPSKIVLMPGADSIDQLLERNQMVAQLCIDNQLRMSTRLHVEIWNKLTGV